MKYLIALFLLVGCSGSKDSTVTALEFPWSSPKSSILNGMIVVESTSYVPFYLSVNPQAITKDSDWDILLYQVDLALIHRFVILDVMFSNLEPSFMQLLKAHLGTRPVLLMVKAYFGYSSDTIDDAWITEETKVLKTFISNLDFYFPNQVIGIRPMALTSGEWFVIPSSPEQAKMVTKAQLALAETIKIYTNGKCLVTLNAGYLLVFTDIQGGSHVEFEDILNSKFVDIISSPYLYNMARFSMNPMIQQVPLDSVPLHNKLFVIEDDTRTSLADPHFGQNFCSTLTCDIDMINRNVTYALEHNAGLYFLDLPNKGWFGRADKDLDSKTLWNVIDTAVHRQIVPSLVKTNFFFDTATMKLTPLISYSYGSMEQDFINKERLGFTKYYLLSDIASATTSENEEVIK